MTISPYSRRGVNDNYYSQINVVRTIEQILGIPPMNQEDHPSTLATTASAASASVPAGERAVYDAWMAWSQHQRFKNAMQDWAKPALLNRLDWYSAHNRRVAYPGDPKVYLPDQVPGRNLPADDIG